MWMWPLDNAMGATTAHRTPERSAGWDRHSSSDLHDQQMDHQDEGSRRIYNQRDLTKEGDDSSEDTWKLQACSIRGGEEELILDRGPRIDFYPSSTPLMILLPNDSAWPLTKSSQRPSSWTRFSTKFIILGLLDLGSLASTMKDPSNQDPTIGAVCGELLVRRWNAMAC